MICDYDLECNFEITKRFVVGDSYTCTAKVFLVDGSTDNLRNVKGSHLEGRTNDDVTFFSVVNQTLSSIPRNLANTFPKLSGIEISNSALKTITSQDLEFLKGLRVFSSYINDVEYLEENLFKFNLKLEWIQFFKNKIRSVGGNLFPQTFNLTQIIRADFRENVCINTNVFTVENVILLLSDRLSVNCPDLYSTTTKIPTESTTEITTTLSTTTITSNQCPSHCLDVIDTANEDLKKKVETLENVVNEQAERILSLEKIIDELKCLVFEDVLTSHLSGNI